jgi:hypothetical protein
MSLIAVPFHLDESLDGFALSRLDSAGRTIRIA